MTTKKAIFGTGDDLQIYHDGSNSYIEDAGTGNLWFKSNGATIGFGNSDLSELFAVFNKDGASKLYFNNSSKIETTSTGVDVAGVIKLTGGYVLDSAHSLRLDSAASQPIAFSVADSEKARIDSSGNLLVGKTTIGVGTSGSEIRADGQISIVREFATPLYINRKSSDGDVVDLRKDNTTFGTIGISSNNLIIKSVLDDKDIQFRGNDGGSSFTALTLDMSQAGEADFNSAVKVAGGITAHQTNRGVLEYASNFFKIRSYGATAGSGSFVINVGGGGGSTDSEAMRIDSSGRMMVGTTSANGVDGVTLNNGGYIYGHKSGGVSGYFDRASSDGDIVEFRKDSSKVGSIGTFGSDIYIGNNDSGLRFEYAGLNAVTPFDVDSLVASDGVTDLGYSNSRFKDLHLSGAVHTGGQLKGSAASSTKLILNATSTQTELHTAGNGGLIFKGSGDNELARIDSSGNLGIGTSSPNVDLHIVHAGGAGLKLETDGDNDANFIQFITSSGSSQGYVGNESSSAGTNFTGTLARAFVLGSTASGTATQFISAGTVKTTIDSSGNVGIGTTSPSNKLDVNGAIRLMGTGTDNDSHILYFNNGACAIARDANDLELHAYNAMVFGVSNTSYPSSTERMRIDSNGTVLVGKTAEGTATDGIELNRNDVLVATRNGDAPLILNRRTSDGDIALLRKDNTTVGSISVTGSATAYNTSSDARLKDVTGTARGLEVINELNPVAYNWKADGKADEGLIAQEVKELVPNAVAGSEAEMYQMDYSKLVVHLVAGMQEQQKQMQEQQAIIEDLQTQLNKLKR